MKITGKHVLVISPEPWKGVQISKHVVARALAAQGNTVCFWDPPDPAESGLRLERDPSGVELVRYHHWFRGVNRFPRAVRDRYYGRLIRRIEALTGRPFDLIWCFDNTRMQEFPPGHATRVLHLVDFDTLHNGQGLIRTADLVLTVSEAITAHARTVHPGVNVHLIGHGLDERWLDAARVDRVPNVPPRTAVYAGLLATDYVDWEMFSAVVLRHPEVHFDLYGPYEADYPAEGFQAIRNAPNTTLHGLVPKERLMPAAHAADILVYCYRAYSLDQKVATSHKVLEYLSTGNVVVGSYQQTLADQAQLLLMAQEREGFIPAFDRACAEHAALNAPALREARIAFARSRTMPVLLDRIGDLLPTP
ncbi:MAG TPA: hypothetical protein VHL57_05330 [Flavobacteriales bacterium]|jgi:hypothetical protein|nr:hypothetical protein [Flavobacteriales bacterium]